MAFFTSAVTVLQTLVIAIGAGLGIWGVINLLEGYGNDNPGANVQGFAQHHPEAERHQHRDGQQDFRLGLRRHALPFDVGFQIVFVQLPPFTYRLQGCSKPSFAMEKLLPSLMCSRKIRNGSE